MTGRRVVLVGIVAIALLTAACDWPTYRGSPAHTGFNAFENTISASNVSTLTEAFSGPVSGLPSSPVVANGVLYVETDTELLAFSAQSTSPCSGSPERCQPLWTAPFTGNPGGVHGGPDVANGIVYAVSGSTLYAYDATGNTNCSGTPKVCQPLWQDYGVGSSPNVANGVVYASDGYGGGDVVGFDAAGNMNCSGTPKVCQPIWIGAASPASGNVGETSPAVLNGVVYIADSKALYAFDATGKTNCAGTPTVCSQLWSAPVGTSSSIADTAAVSNGTVYISNDSTGTLYAFDATGSTNCSGSPKSCSPLWTASGVYGPLAIANGMLYDEGQAFSATGTTDCSGSPKVCTALFSFTAPNFADPFHAGPVVANGVLYATSGNGAVPGSGQGLYAWDASGTRNCSGVPKVCSPLFSYQSEAAVFGDPAVASGMVYFADGDGFHSEEAVFAFKLS